MVEPQEARARPEGRAVTAGTTTGRAVGARILFTGLGAVALIIGGFQKWAGRVTGQRIHLKALVQSVDPAGSAPARFLHSAGLLMVILGLIALAGLAFRSGWVTRAAGAAGVVAATLFLIQLYRTPGHPAPGPGVWVCLAGGLLTAVAGFVGTGREGGPGPDGTVAEA